MFRKDPLKKWKIKKKNNKFLFIIGSLTIFIILFYLLYIGNKDNMIKYSENNFIITSNFLINNKITLTPNQIISGEIKINIENNNNINYILKAYRLVKNEYVLNDDQEVLISYANIYDEPSGLINKINSKTIKLTIENTTKSVQKIKIEPIEVTNEFDTSNITNINYEGDIEFITYIDGELAHDFPNSKNYNPNIICKSSNEIVDVDTNIVWEEDKWNISINDVYYFNLSCEIDFFSIMN